MGPFMTFLRKNFTVEEYMERMDAGETPLDIVKSKGYIAAHIKAQMKKAGYPVTQAGHDEWWAAEMKKSELALELWRLNNPAKEIYQG